MDYISLGDSLILSLVGFSVVLFALGLLAIFIIFMAKIIGKLNSKPTALEVKATSPAPVVNADANKVELPKDTSMGQCNFHNVSDRDAAMIMAIVADNLKVPLNTLDFKSIKEIKE